MTNNDKKVLRITGQVIVIFIILSLAIPLIVFNLPGHRNFCDPDQKYLFCFVLTFLVLSIGFLINSIIFYYKKHWTKYRLVAITFTLLLIIFLFSARTLVTNFFYGKVIYTITNENNAMTLISVKLFENKRFISNTYDLSCNIEKTGTYKLSDNMLVLQFNGEKSKYLETKYNIENNTLKCSDCEYDIELILNNN